MTDYSIRINPKIKLMMSDLTEDQMLTFLTWLYENQYKISIVTANLWRQINGKDTINF